jgi:hypothetical protein
MLYDSVNDSDETENLANEPEHTAVVTALQQLIVNTIEDRDGF